MKQVHRNSQMLTVSVVKYGSITIPMSRVIHIPCGGHRQSSHKILNMAHNVHNDIIILRCTMCSVKFKACTGSSCKGVGSKIEVVRPGACELNE